MPYCSGELYSYYILLYIHFTVYMFDVLVFQIFVLLNQVFPDNFIKREVLALKINCLAKNEGCNWKGDVRDLEVNNNTHV